MRHTVTQLDRVGQNGTSVFRIRGTGLKLMRKNSGTGRFEPVNSIEGSISAKELDQCYGVSDDRNVRDFRTYRQDERSSITTSILHNSAKIYELKASRIELRAGKPVLKAEWVVVDGFGHGTRYWSPLAPAL